MDDFPYLSLKNSKEKVYFRSEISNIPGIIYNPDELVNKLTVSEETVLWNVVNTQIMDLIRQMHLNNPSTETAMVLNPDERELEDNKFLGDSDYKNGKIDNSYNDVVIGYVFDNLNNGASNIAKCKDINIYPNTDTEILTKFQVYYNRNEGYGDEFKYFRIILPYGLKDKLTARAMSDTNINYITFNYSTIPFINTYKYKHKDETDEAYKNRRDDEIRNEIIESKNEDNRVDKFVLDLFRINNNPNEITNFKKYIKNKYKNKFKINKYLKNLTCQTGHILLLFHTCLGITTPSADYEQYGPHELTLAKQDGMQAKGFEFNAERKDQRSIDNRKELLRTEAAHIALYKERIAAQQADKEKSKQGKTNLIMLKCYNQNSDKNVKYFYPKILCLNTPHDINADCSATQPENVYNTPDEIGNVGEQPYDIVVEGDEGDEEEEEEEDEEEAVPPAKGNPTGGTRKRKHRKRITRTFKKSAAKHRTFPRNKFKSAAKRRNKTHTFPRNKFKSAAKRRTFKKRRTFHGTSSKVAAKRSSKPCI